ncbi:MAG: T9SS type A sorting domain-containing protein, partial [Bacteroidales bacterium]|nr:T9SS type A sorting domain-containing protein [Bacteroidales bacterium]
GTPNLSVFSFQFSTSHGCDSTVTLHLTISQPVTETVEVNVCENDLPYHYVNGDIDTTFNVGTPNLSVFNFQFSTQYGCDSTVILTLNIRSANHTEFSETACGNYTWNNEVYEESGDYVQTFTNANGCDSVVTLHLTIYPTVTELDEVTVCESDLPYHYVNGDIDTTFEVGTPNLSVFSFQFLTSHGCDSTVTLRLTISQPVTETVEVTVCENDLPYHYVNGDIDTTFDVGTPNLSVFNFQFSTSHGCDSTVTLHLTIFTADYADFADNACGSYTWNNEVYEESGDYVQTFTNANGCDSVVTLHLTIYPTVNVLDEVTICKNDLPYHYVNGDIDTTFEVGTPNLSVFNFQFSTQYGCDSIVSLTLIVNASDTDSIRIVDVDLGDRIRLYPNPTLGKVLIDVRNGVEIQQISIFDLTGREVNTPSFSATSHSEIDLSDCVHGIYMVRIVTNEGILVRKITRM